MGAGVRKTSRCGATAKPSLELWYASAGAFLSVCIVTALRIVGIACVKRREGIGMLQGFQLCDCATVVL